MAQQLCCGGGGGDGDFNFVGLIVAVVIAYVLLLTCVYPSRPRRILVSPYPIPGL